MHTLTRRSGSLTSATRDPRPRATPPVSRRPGHPAAGPWPWPQWVIGNSATRATPTFFSAPRDPATFWRPATPPGPRATLPALHAAVERLPPPPPQTLPVRLPREKSASAGLPPGSEEADESALRVAARGGGRVRTAAVVSHGASGGEASAAVVTEPGRAGPGQGPAAG